MRHTQIPNLELMPPSLSGVWAKIAHAKDHRDALNKYISDTFAEDGNRPKFGVKFEPQSGDYVTYISRMPDLEPFLLEVGLRVGDIVHDLHSALDHIVLQVALLHKGGLTPEEARSGQFPITTTPSEFKKARKRRLRHVAPGQWAKFEKFQPYDTRANTGLPDTYIGPWIHPLQLLWLLSAEDKHRVIITTVLDPGSFAGTTGTGAFAALMSIMDDLDGRSVSVAPRVELGTVIGRGRARGKPRLPDVEVDGYMTPCVCLPEKRPVIETLDRIASYVVHVVREFEPLF